MKTLLAAVISLSFIVTAKAQVPSVPAQPLIQPKPPETQPLIQPQPTGPVILGQTTKVRPTVLWWLRPRKWVAVRTTIVGVPVAPGTYFIRPTMIRSTYVVPPRRAYYWNGRGWYLR